MTASARAHSHPTANVTPETEAAGDTGAEDRRQAEILARGHRLDRRIPSFLLRSPLSRIGYALATAVGMIWGCLWSTGKIERKDGMWVFRGMPNMMFPRGGTCVGACFLTGDREPSDAVLRHEQVHRNQWLRYGYLLPALYALAGRNPLHNRFEIEAGLEDGGYLPHQRAR